MAASKIRLSSLKLFQRYNIHSNYTATPKLFCSMSNNNDSSTTKKSGFSVFDQKQKEYLEQTLLETSGKPKDESFVSLLKNSKFIAMGNPIGKVVVGEIYLVVGKDLYIDFGWKFPTVCTAPEKFKKHYVVGTKVKLLIKDLELASKFLGGDEEITLNEADCVLLGLVDRSVLKNEADQ